MEKKEILIYDNAICIGLYPVEKVLYDSYPIIVYGDVIIFDNDPPVSVLFFADVEYGMVISEDIVASFSCTNVIDSANLQLAIEPKMKDSDLILTVSNEQIISNARIGIDLANSSDMTAYPGDEYLSRFAYANKMDEEEAKEQAICKECLKSYEEEK